MECEPCSVSPGPKAACERGFSETYLIVQGDRSGENGPAESDIGPPPPRSGQQVTRQTCRKPATQRGARPTGERDASGNWRTFWDSNQSYAYWSEVLHKPKPVPASNLPITPHNALISLPISGRFCVSTASSNAARSPRRTTETSPRRSPGWISIPSISARSASAARVESSGSESALSSVSPEGQAAGPCHHALIAPGGAGGWSASARSRAPGHG